MNRARIALLGLFAVLVAVWVSSATLPPPPVPRPAPVPSAKAAQVARQSTSIRSRDMTTFDLSDAAERLHARLATRSQTPAIERNPFEFGQPLARRVAAPAPAPRVLLAAPPAPAGPLPPPFELTGVAEQKTGDTLERTAILTGNDQMYFAKRGDRLLGRYEVTGVSPEAIELREIDSGRVLRLGLR